MCRLRGSRKANCSLYSHSALGEQKAKVIEKHTSLVYTMVVRNITFSADEELIESARAVAKRNDRSLNDEFRDWLAKYAASGSNDKFSYRKLVEQLGEVKMTRKYTRDEMNERR